MSGRHLDEGVLVRLVDGEVSDLDRALLVAHLEECTDCARSRSAIESRSHALAALLTRTDPSPRAFVLTSRRRAPRTPVRWWRAAAAIVLLVGAAVFLQTPVRAWILERWTDLRRVIGGAPHTTETQPPGRAVDSAGAVSFLPASDVLYLHVATRQAEGQLVIEMTDSPRVSAEVSAAGTRGAEFVVLPGELRIANSTTSQASYHIAVPRRLTRVIVSIAGESPTVIASPGERRIVTLSIQTRKP